MTGRFDVLRLVAPLGPVRRIAPRAWVATCPACREDRALVIRLLGGGQLPACRNCGVAVARAAINRLNDPKESG